MCMCGVNDDDDDVTVNRMATQTMTIMHSSDDGDAVTSEYSVCCAV